MCRALDSTLLTNSTNVWQMFAAVLNFDALLNEDTRYETAEAVRQFGFDASDTAVISPTDNISKKCAE